jgi:hypothetical protein
MNYRDGVSHMTIVAIKHLHHRLYRSCCLLIHRSSPFSSQAAAKDLATDNDPRLPHSRRFSYNPAWALYLGLAGCESNEEEEEGEEAPPH